jgi:hypothetical protein
LASGFVLWLVGFLGAGVALGKGHRLFAHARYLPAVACLVVAGVFGVQSWNAVPDALVVAAPGENQLPNRPVGTARGAYPGRVTWVYDRAATTWDGVETGSGETRGWWGTSDTAGGEITGTFTDQTVVDSMVSRNLQWLTGTGSDEAAWEVLFQHFNESHGKGSVGYASGERIHIKTNWVTTMSLPEFGRDEHRPAVCASGQ